MGISSKRHFIRMALSAGMLVLSLRSTALAQPSPPASGEGDLQAQATQLYNEGTKAAKANQWDKARAFYLSAWRVQQHWQIAASLGRAEFKTGKFRDAAEHLRFFLLAASRVPASDRKATEEMLDKARAKIGALTITANQTGAEIQLDGEQVGKVPLNGELFIEPGQHIVEARLEGYEPAKVAVDVEAGRQVPVNLMLAQKTEPKKPEIAVAPVCPPSPKPIEVATARNNGLVAAGAVIAGIAALAGGGGMIVAKFYFDDRVEAEPTCKRGQFCPAYDAAERPRQIFAVASLASYIVAGAVGLGTLTYALASPSPKPRSSAKADLVVGPGVAGATVTVQW